MNPLFLVATLVVAVSGNLFFPGNYVPIQGTDKTTESPPAPQVSDLPKFCHNLDCPRFSVVQSLSNDTELRHYEASMWVATEVVVMQYTREENSKMFRKLFHYISGNNTMNMKIPMTAPVVTEVFHGQGPDCESNFTMYFMMPFNLQTNPPTPTEKGVFISRKPAFNAYVKTYGGFSTDDMKREKLVELVSEVGESSDKFYDNVFMTAGYDGPYTFSNRHNEIWVIAK